MSLGYQLWHHRVEVPIVHPLFEYIRQQCPNSPPPYISALDLAGDPQAWPWRDLFVWCVPFLGQPVGLGGF